MVNTKSTIYAGTLFHKRFLPKVHHFTYPVYTVAVDLNDLSSLSKTCIGFKYNQFSLLSIWAKDYLNGPQQDLYQKAKSFISTYHSQALASQIHRMVLVTSPRFLNYVFNPVSFFYGYDSANTLRVILAEVHNTFGEAHVYILDAPITHPNQKVGFKIDKRFHVSPFFDRQGGYHFLFSPLDKHLTISITLMDNESPKLLATLTGSALPFTSASIFKMLLNYPLSIVLTMPRIIYQAAILFFLKKLSIYKKPVADDVMTIKKKESQK
jgi:cyclopropane-fatty-acyl-phospholipid synthase